MVVTNEAFVYFEADYSIIRLHYNKGFVLNGKFVAWANLALFQSFLSCTHCREQRSDFLGKMVHHH
jgi:hypothetical protein